MATRRADDSQEVGLTLVPSGNSHLTFTLATDESDPLWRGGALHREDVRKRQNENSVNVKYASVYLFGCCFYNSCCCCFSHWIGPWCGNTFCYNKQNLFANCGFKPRLVQLEIAFRRDRWLSLLHGICFAIHIFFVVLTYTTAKDSDMSIAVVRIKPSWASRAEYAFEAAPSKHQILYIDALTMVFFACSATMHGMWVFVGGFQWSEKFLWNQLDDCLCWWRWLEYSVSASTMMVAIATVTGLRDQNSLVAIFFLTVATMCCGFFTEMISRPAKFADGKTDYGRWQGDPERPSEQGSESKEQMRARLWARIRNYAWRMLPHTLGFLPYCAAWAIIINNFLEQLDDLCDEIRDRMPDFVPYIVYGCCAIFSLFTFVQWRYQWTAPKHYWRTEVHYCILSATAKVFLGGLLFSNVLVKSSFEEGVQGSSNFTSVADEFCNKSGV